LTAVSVRAGNGLRTRLSVIAMDGFRAARGGKAKELAEVEAFLAKHKGAP